MFSKKFRRVRLILIHFFAQLSVLSCILAAEPASCPHCSKAPVDAKALEGMDIALVSENLTIEPGKAFRVGFKLDHKKGFHTYWKNPGVVGVPTKMNWELPEGVTVSEIQWPNPELSKMAVYPCFGYERDVLLMMEVSIPKSWSEETITLTGQGQWMCCSSMCYPGFETFSLTLKVGEEESCPKYAPLFEAAEKELPAESDKLTAKMLTKADDKAIQLLITSKDAELQVIRIFNEDGQTTPDIHHGIKRITEDEFVFITERSKYGPKGPTAFPCVVETNFGFFKVNPSY